MQRLIISWKVITVSFSISYGLLDLMLKTGVHQLWLRLSYVIQTIAETIALITIDFL